MARERKYGANRWGSLALALPLALVVLVSQLPTPGPPPEGGLPPRQPSELQLFELQSSLLLSLAPLLFASFLRPKPVAIIGAIVSLGPLTFYGLQTGTLLSGSHIIRLLVSLIVVLCGVILSRNRVRNEEKLGQITRVAAAVQQAVLAPVPAQLGAVSLAAKYVSASEEATVGGDFYDAIATPFGTRVLLGDVRGKGIEAVRITNHLLGAFRHLGKTSSATELVAAMDSAMSDAGGYEDFATAVVVDAYAHDDHIRVHIHNAGHPAPLLIAGGGSRLVEAEHVSLPLGLGAKTEPQEVVLGIGEVLLLYTDGLAEARRRGEFLPLEASVAKFVKGTHPSAVIDGMYAALIEWTGSGLGDDVALLALGPARADEPLLSTHRAGAAQ